MSIGAVIASPLFNDYISGGLAPADTEVRIAMLERWNANLPWESEANIEYALWPQNDLGSIGAPFVKGFTESTDSGGVLVINVAGVFAIGATVLIAVRKEAAGPSAETVFALGEVQVTEV